MLHAGLGIGVFASGVWNIERLDSNFRSSPGLAVLMPPMPAPSGAPDLPKVEIEKKQKKIVKDTVQLEVHEDHQTKPAEVPSTTSGSGTGSGSGSGSAIDKGECLIDCGPGDGSDAAPPVVKKDPPKNDEDTFVPPNVLTMMRTSGSTQIHPSEVTKIAMQRDGRTKTTGVAKVCVSELGSVTHVSMLQSTKYPAYDATLMEGIRSWTYKPYAAKGRNVKVCGTVTFIYGMN